MTLHEAIRKVLLEANSPLPAKKITEAININQLYVRGDLNPVPISQVLARINSYKEIFEKDGEMISIRNLSGVLVEKLLESSLKWFRNMSAHGRISLEGYFIIPFCFFFKRVTDNEDLQLNLFHEPREIKCNHSDFLRFIELLKETYPQMRQPLTEFVESVVKENHEDIDLLLDNISEIDLRASSLSDAFFSDFYIRTIRTLVSQDFSKGFFYTPDTIAELFSELAGLNSFNRIYNPAAGISSLPVMLKKKHNNQQFFFSGDEIEPRIYLLAFTLLIISKINIDDFILGDSLKRPYNVNGDLILCNPPFNVVFPHKYGFREPPVNNINKSHHVFLASIIFRLKKWHRAIILVPENFLFSNDLVDRQLKGYLLRNGLLEGIVSLPAGIYQPYSGIKTSILILNNRKRTEFTYLVDAEHLYFRKNPEKNEIVLETNRIIEVIRAGLNKIDIMTPEDLVMEPDSLFKSGYISIRALGLTDYNLSVKRYIANDQTSALEDKNLVKLSDILEFHLISKSKEKLKYVKISNLNSDYIEFKLKTADLKVEAKPGNYLEGEAILIGSISGSYKPTYYDEDEPILVSPNIYVLRIRYEFQNRILPEYLISELAGKEFTERLNLLSVGGTALKRIPRTDLLNLKIYVPEIEEQKAIVRAKKEAILAARAGELSYLEDRSGPDQIGSFDYMGFVQHEYNNIAGGIANYIETIKLLLGQNPIDRSSKLSDRKNSPTVYDALESVNQSIKSITNLFETIRVLLNVNTARLNLQNTSFNSLIENGCSRIPGLTDNFLLLKRGEGSKFKDVQIPVDPELFSIVISNFISNSAKHGFDAEDAEKILLFDLREDDDFYYLSMINNGKPFPIDFNNEDFVSFGKRADLTKGSGIGGYIMNEIIKKHGGELTVHPLKEIINVKEKDTDYVLKRGIQFQIRLQKTN